MSDPPSPDTPPTHAGPPTPAPASHGRRRRRWPVVLVIVVVLVGILVAVTDQVDLSVYALTPGQAQPVGRLLHVPSQKAHPDHGSVLMVDVYITRLTALNYLFFRLNGNAQLVTATNVLGPVTPPQQLATQGYLEMAQSQAAAKAAAFRQLGYDVAERNAGALLFAVKPGSPASSALHIGQVVTAVDGTATPDVCTFVSALSAFGPGSDVTLSVEHSKVTPKAVVVPGPVVDETVRLGQWPKSEKPTAVTTCPGSPVPNGYLGVQIETMHDFTYPFKVTVATTQIGGPSAGLAMTLGIIDTLSDGELTGGRTVAATGTIGPDGSVGPVGGVPQKTVAVEHAGATVFFVPARDRATAMSKAVPSLHVYGVTSLAQVLSRLASLGGTVPQEHQSGGSAS